MKPNAFSRIHRSITFALCLSCLPMSSCVTSGTRDQVLSGNMDAQLEKKVLRQTGVSGAVIGAAGGAIVGAGGGIAKEFFDSVLEGRQFNRDRARDLAIKGAIFGGVTGGFIGYQAGRRQGEQLVYYSMSRDNIDNLLKGARAYNEGLRTYNERLRNRIAATRKESDTSKRKSRYRSLETEARTELASVDNRIAERRKAAGNVKWSSDQRQEYKNTLGPLIQRRDVLKKQVDTVSKLRSEGVY